MLRRLVLACALVLGVAAIVSPQTASADTSAGLPMTGFTHLAVGGPSGYVFLTGAGAQGVVVRNADGSAKTVITGEDNAGQIVVSPDGSTLYVARSSDGVIDAIDTTTLARTQSYATGDNCPASIAATATAVWFAYGCSGGYGVGAIDLTQDPAVVTLGAATPTTTLSLVASPATPDRLFTATNGSPSQLTEYTISGTTLTATASGQVEEGPSDMTVDHGGSDLLVASGAPYYIGKYKTSDLTADGQYGADNPYPNSVAVSSSDYVAEGLDASYDPDIRIYAGAGSQVRTFDYGVCCNVGDSDMLAPAGLAFNSSGSRLYAVTTDYTGAAVTLRVLQSPTVPLTVMTASAPTSAKRGYSLAVTGGLTALGTPIVGATVLLSRSDASGTHVAGSLTTNSLGKYTFHDTPTVGGTVTYTITYHGDATHFGTTKSAKVVVSRATPYLSIGAAHSIYTYGQTASIAVSLGTTYNSRTVSIYATPYGGRLTLIKTGKVDSHGRLSATYHLLYRTVFTVRFYGDYRYAYMAKAVTVNASGSLAATLVGAYKTSGGYKLFHTKYDAAILAHIAPNKVNECMQFYSQYYRSGAWHNGPSDACEYIDSDSYAAALFHGAIGTPFRLRAVYGGDGRNTYKSTGWLYLRFTS